MKEISITSKIKVFDTFEEMDSEAQNLANKAREATQLSHAPYSKYHVGCAILLENNEIVLGANQENASYPVCICAEGVALNNAACNHPNIPIKAMAVAVNATFDKNGEPVAPCGVCRQNILEYENKYGKNIRILLIGKNNKVMDIENVKSILPLSFSGDNLE